MRRTRHLVVAAVVATLSPVGVATPALADNPIVTDIYTADPATLRQTGSPTLAG